MCGIAGGFRHLPSAEEGSRLLLKLAHRGPDNSGLWTGERVWLANTRLAIQDLTDSGRQPMHSSDGRYTIVYNGELYNAAALRQDLQGEGVQFFTRCDTEVLLHAYIKHGSGCLSVLNGDFAFAVWDDARKELFVARDPMGVKPLYIYNDGKKLLFSSEIKALLGLHGLDYSLQPSVFADYLTYLYSPSATTPFLHIKKLLPGHYLRCAQKDGIGEPIMYHRIEMRGKEYMEGRDWHRELEALLLDTVKKQLVSDAPVGVMLSGGLDSSLIAAFAKKTAPGLPIRAFSMRTTGMAAEGFEDDLPYATTVAASLGMPLQEVDGALFPSGNWIDELVWQLDEPQADPAAWYTSFIAKNAREAGIKVLLSGTGGDDVLSGYRRHQAIAAYRIMRMIPGCFKAGANVLQRLPLGKSALLRRAVKLLAASGLSGRQAAIHSHFWTAPADVRRLMSRNHPPAVDPYAHFEQLLEEIPDEQSLLQQMLFWEQRTFLPHHNLAYLDKMGMAHSVEMRVPFVDKEVVALAAAMPAQLKLRNGKTKVILREIARPYLPSSIISRKKTGFGAPMRQWMQGQLKPIVHERLTDSSFIGSGIFNESEVNALISDTESGKKDGSYTLFSLLCIESWLRQFAPSS